VLTLSSELSLLIYTRKVIFFQSGLQGGIAFMREMYQHWKKEWETVVGLIYCFSLYGLQVLNSEGNDALLDVHKYLEDKGRPIPPYSSFLLENTE